MILIQFFTERVMQIFKMYKYADRDSQNTFYCIEYRHLFACCMAEGFDIN